MKKTLLTLLFMCTTCGLILADINLIQPAGGQTLTRGTSYQIRWSGPASEGSQVVTIFIETPNTSSYWIVDDSRTKADGFFDWTVGRIKNGTILPAGQYKISLETLDGDAFGQVFTIVNPTFTINPKWLKALMRQRIRIPHWPPPPHCPQCLRLDLRGLRQMLGIPVNRYQLFLLRGNQRIAKLGEFGRGKRLPGYASIKLGSRARKMKLKTLPIVRGQKYKIIILSSKGRTIHSQAVQLFQKR